MVENGDEENQNVVNLVKRNLKDILANLKEILVNLKDIKNIKKYNLCDNYKLKKSVEILI